MLIDLNSVQLSLTIRGKTRQLQSTAKIRICTYLSSVNYFQFVSETIGVDSTILPRRLQNLVKIGQEMRM